MQNATRDPRIQFVAAGAFWSAALLLVLRSPIGERAIVAPFVAWHAALAFSAGGGSPVAIDLSCSGSDVIALSMAALLAYPLPWRRRLLGVGVGVIWLACLNLIRIVTLMNTAGTPLFAPLHLYIWPAILIGGAAAFVFVWIWIAEHRVAADAGAEFARARTLVAVTALFVVAYVAVVPWALGSDVLQRAAIRIAGAAAALLRMAGANAVTGGSTLVVGQQAFLITPECITTPLMPVYLAWALVWSRTRRARVAAVALFVPIFFVLSVLRLLTVALPAVIGPTLYLTHGFYQILIGFLLIAVAAHVRAHDAQIDPTSRRLVVSFAAAFSAALLLARPYTWLIDAAARAVSGIAPHAVPAVASAADTQGAFAIMPGYELALACGLSVAWFGRAARGPLMLVTAAAAVLQVATIAGAGELAAHFAVSMPVTAVRAVSILTPSLLVAAVAARHHRSAVPTSRLVETAG